MVQHITKVMVLGETGMLGHVLKKVMENAPDIELVPAPTKRIVDYDSLTEYVHDVVSSDAKYIINALGVVKPRVKDVGTNMLYMINSILPAVLYQNRGDKVTMQISSDCVWSGTLEKGRYDALSTPDAMDDYGKSKALGETGDYIYRTSIIGPELNGQRRGLLMNLLTADKIQGWNHHKWSGVTTLQLAKQILRDIQHLENDGIVYSKYQLIASAPLTKYDLAVLINVVFNLNKEVEFVDAEPIVNRAFYSDTRQPTMAEQLIELKQFMKEHEGLYDV